MPSHPTKIFISYTQADRAWAEWIAWQLEDAGFQTILQAWHFGPGSNFVQQMHQAVQEADRTIAVLSPEYEKSGFGLAEWTAAFAQDPTSMDGTLVPVRVEPFNPEGLLGQIVYIDLVDLEEDAARQQLLNGLHKPHKPDSAPAFPRPHRQRAKQFPAGLPARWNVPHQRNRFFTGRGDVLLELHQALNHKGSLALGQAISGLGGIGKTQTAVEFAYRYRDEYTAVFWSRAETEPELIAGMVEISGMLELPEKDKEDQELAVQAVRQWMAGNASWLWVLDNADTPSILQRFLPIAHRGHLLVTSRAENFDVLEMDPLKVPLMPSQEAIAFLLERTRRQDPPAEEREAATTLAEELGFLPLALEQAAAYVSSHHSLFVDYLASYRGRRLKLLDKGQLRDGREPVATTWSLNFDQVAGNSPAAGELLHLCAFFAPDQIPIEVLIKGAEKLGPALAEALEGAAADPLLIGEVLEPLSRYSLIERDLAARTFSVHRMVQAVVKDAMAKNAKRSWAERAVEGLSLVYPGPDLAAWPLCDRLVPHWRMATYLIDRYKLESIAAGALLSHFAYYSHERARFLEAEMLLQRTIKIQEKVLGHKHPELATSLNNLGLLYNDRGRYDDAKPLYSRAIEIQEKSLGHEHPTLATSLSNLALLASNQGRYDDAEPLYIRAIEITEKALGREHPLLAASLNNLAALYRSQGRYEDAKPLIQRDIEITEKTLGQEHPQLAVSLNNLAILYYNQGRYGDAEPLYRRSNEIIEKVLGHKHPQRATGLNNLATLYLSQKRYDDAESLIHRAIEIYENALGHKHPDLATSLTALAVLYLSQKRYDDAELLFRRAIEIYKNALGQEHPDLATSLENYSILLRFTGRGDQAKEIESKANAIRARREAMA